MSSDSDTADIPDDIPSGEMHFIAERMKRYPEILDKSQVPLVKMEKKKALQKILQEYTALFGKDLEEKLFMKKVNNMKTRLKAKTVKNIMSNKPIRLLPWEKIVLETMQGDDSPTGGLQIGLSPRRESAALPPYQPEIPFVHSSPVRTRDERNSNTSRAPVVQKRAAETQSDDTLPQDTDETRTLSTSQLQRLVLLEQLKAARLQQEYFATKMADR